MATITADSASYADVNTAYGLCSDGDTLSIPTGTPTWATTLAITKKIVLQGSGKSTTVITNTGGRVISLDKDGARITGLGFVSNGVHFITVRQTGWRIDHCDFVNNGASSVEAVRAQGGSTDPPPVGLIDNCTCTFSKVMVYGDASLTPHEIWYESLGLGTDNAVFVEDCTFTWSGFGNCMDSQYGGRYVFRHNTVIDSSVEAHSAGGGEIRAARSWEIYDNSFEAIGETPYYPFRLRGGTGVVFNNTITGPYQNQDIALDNVRSCSYDCDGSDPKDGNAPGEAGYACRDQIGRSKDAFEYSGVGDWPSQELDPAYAWDNTDDGGTAIMVSMNCAESQAHIVENRDFYNGSAKPDYTSYTYPHPLQAIDGGESGFENSLTMVSK